MAVTSVYSAFDSIPIDTALQLADAQTITTSAAATVAASAKVLDLGASNVDFVVQIDVGAVNVATGDRSCILIQGCNTADFTTGSPVIQNLAEIAFGDVASIGASADNAGDERFLLFGRTWRKGTVYRYVRLYVLAAGSPSMAIVTAYLAPVRP